MEVSNLTLSFSNKIVLREANFRISKGELVFVIGHSGSGKTSLIRALIGDFEPKNGKVILDDGSVLYEHNKDKNFLLKYRRNIGVIFQDYKLLSSKNVYENIAFAMEVCGYNDKQISKKVPEVLEQVGLLIKRDKFIDELSGGEKQRVAIARALVNNPDILIGDEPTGNLDPKTAVEIMEIFDELNKEGKTVIIATHDENIVNKYKKRVITVSNGKIISDKKNSGYDL